jgi:hypothetical protein
MFDRRARSAFFVACIVLLGSSVGFNWAVHALNVYLRKLPVAMRGTFDTIPRVMGRWEAVGDDRIFDEAMIEELGTNKYLDRDYALDGDRRQAYVNLHLAYYTGMIDAVPHVPDRCFEAAGLNLKTLPQNLDLSIDQTSWLPDAGFVNLATGEPYRTVAVVNSFTGLPSTVRMPVGEFKLRTTEFESPRQPNFRVYGGYFFVANGRVTPSPGDVKAMAFKPSEKYAYYCKVQFTFGGAQATPEQFVTLVEDFLKDFLPELMLRLPDWAQVERQNATQNVP